MAEHETVEHATLDAASQLVRRARRDATISKWVTIAVSTVIVLALSVSNWTLVKRLDDLQRLEARGDCSRVVSAQVDAGVAQSFDGISKYLAAVTSPDPLDRQAAKDELQSAADKLTNAARRIRACNGEG